jgi:hypothetical protein
MKINTNLFEELTFVPHRNSQSAISARKEFDSGHAISVTTGDGMYGDLNEQSFKDSTFEVAVFDPDGDFIKLTLHDDVIGHRSADEVSEIMVKIGDDPDSLRVNEQVASDS